MSYQVLYTSVKIKYRKRYYEGRFKRLDKNTTEMHLKGFPAHYIVSQNIFWAASGSNVRYMVDKL